LVDLSLNGCLIELTGRPDLVKQQSVWVHSHSFADAEWTEGRIASVTKTWSGKRRVGIAFRTPIAYERFKILVYGRDISGESPTHDSPEHERDHFWK
jgi:hypothetical protein